MEKRGQTTIFIVVAMIIVVAGILIYFLVPGVRTVFSSELSPSGFIESCITEELDANLETLSLQGGYSNPEGFILYNNLPVKYLCYTAQYYQTCNIQQPLLISHVEEELESALQTKANDCVRQLAKEYEQRGFEVSSGQATVDVEIILEKIRVAVNAPLTASSQDSTQTFTSFSFEKPKKLYALLLIAGSVIDYEATYGDTETNLYVAFYPYLKIQKMKLEDGSKIYTLEDVTTNEK